MKARPFIHDDFLLETSEARHLYHDFAKAMPILDYHCHLPPEQIAGDRRYRNLTELWLGGDHYKWRAMRTNGVPEVYCTGDAPDREKFDRWAATMPALLRNPLYHWSQLELARYFGVTDLLGPNTAGRIWDACNEQIASKEFSCRGLIRRSNVRLICTTDDPVDSLEHHLALAKDKSFGVRVIPAWRPDKGLAVEDPQRFNAWADLLSAAADTEIRDWDSYLNALRKRHAYFHAAGCRLSDHGLDTMYAAEYRDADVAAAFARLRSGHAPDSATALQLKSAMLFEFAVMDHARGWTQQFHIGAMRNNNSRMFAKVGPDTGFDSIGDADYARPLSAFLDRLDGKGRLARTILYNLNPRDNAMLATMLGNFQDGETAGKVQWGSGWWFLDQKDGMEEQMNTLSLLGLLSRFIGMTTDSRSFLSYTRHEYFRRILCNLLGRDMVLGLIPDDMELVGRMVQDISYHNADRYFRFSEA